MFSISTKKPKPDLELVVFVGLQASGKTSFYEEKFADTHVHVSKDSFPKVRNRDGTQHRLMQEAFIAGKSVVLDNTNPTRDDRAVALAIAHGYGAKARAYYFESVVAQSMKRNANRFGKAQVPLAAILSTSFKLTMPSYEEGFLDIKYVSIRDDKFVVKDWRP